MRVKPIVLAAVVVAMISGAMTPAFAGDAGPAASTDSATVYRYPSATRSNQVDTYFGTKVADPYRYLEHAKDPRTKSWVAAEDSLARSYLDTLPTLESRTAQLKGLWNYARYSPPKQRGDRLFWLENDGTQSQDALYWSNAPVGERHLALDPNTLSTDGTSALAFFSPSPDGHLLAWGESVGGSDWRTIRLRNVDTGQDLPDVVRWAKFTDAVWLPDGSGFFYSGYDEPKDPSAQAVNIRVYLHLLGTSQADDRVIYADPAHPEALLFASIPSGQRRLWVEATNTTDSNQLLYVPLDKLGAPLVPLGTPADSLSNIVRDDGDFAWMITNVGAPNKRVVKVDLRSPATATWVDVIPEQKDPLEQIGVSGSQFLTSYLHDVTARLRLYGFDGTAGPTATLPVLGAVSSISASDQTTTAYYSLDVFTSPSPVMALDTLTGHSTTWKVADGGFDASRYVTDQVFVTSKDGTKVPAFIVHRKDVKPNGKNPTLLYGFGGFGVTFGPWYTVADMAWIERGGVYVQANLRGGGEYGNAWYDAGKLLKRQNVYDDFYAVAEWLVDKKWTNTSRLAIHGEGNGGLLVGTAITQHPELFGAAITEMGVLDMLRYHTFTIGALWAGDYGRSDTSKKMFEYLLGYSPVHNVDPGTKYPATLVMAADGDDRVVPAHSYKFAAELQAENASGKPIIMRVESRGGHSVQTSTEQAIAEAADRLAFLDSNLGVAPVVPAPIFLAPTGR